MGVGRALEDRGFFIAHIQILELVLARQFGFPSGRFARRRSPGCAYLPPSTMDAWACRPSAWGVADQERDGSGGCFSPLLVLARPLSLALEVSSEARSGEVQEEIAMPPACDAPLRWFGRNVWEGTLLLCFRCMAVHFICLRFLVCASFRGIIVKCSSLGGWVHELLGSLSYTFEG